MAPRYLGRDILYEKLRLDYGYSRAKAMKVVNAFIQCMKTVLKEKGKIKIPGLGTLTVVTRNQKRTIRKFHTTYPFKKPTLGILLIPKQAKTIRLKRVVLWPTT